MSSAINPTLRHVTARKLSKLDELHRQYEEKRKEILKAARAKSAPAGQLAALLTGLEKHDMPISRTTLASLDISIGNLAKFLAQSCHDPSVSEKMLEQWQLAFEQALAIESRRFGFARLFGKCVIEWLEERSERNTEAGKVNESEKDDDDSSTADDGSSSASSISAFQTLGRAEMYEQRKEWDARTFSNHTTDVKSIEEYLKSLFDSTLKSKKFTDPPILSLQKAIAQFDPLGVSHFDVQHLKMCIRGVLQSDIFSGSKREALVDFLSQPSVLKEMADVMKMDLANIDDWNWQEPVPLVMRRQLNGKYRVYMDEEIHDALILYWVGVNWAVHLKAMFRQFFHSGAWLTRTGNGMSKKYRARRNYFLGVANGPNGNVMRHRGGFRGRGEFRGRGSRGRGRGGYSTLSTRRTYIKQKSVRDMRRAMFEEEYFIAQLPNSINQGYRDYDDNNDDNPSLSRSTRDELPSSRVKPPLAVKQSLLRLATTEMHLNTALYGEHTILQTDFKWFGPSLPHSTIFSVLEFLGFTKKWLLFFQKFLQAPLFFASDGVSMSDPIQRRTCGVPISHALSDVLTEAILFCLDFAVNQKTGGHNLYRLHDDVWFWGSKGKCEEAWKAIIEFSDIMGLELNTNKTGTAFIIGKPLSPATRAAVAPGDNTVHVMMDAEDSAYNTSSLLPFGQIRWGFLVLDPIRRNWNIDQALVSTHIAELRIQLSQCKSVFAWIQAWNSYATHFLSSNFGRPANCLGKEHVDMVLATFKRIQTELFGDDQSPSMATEGASTHVKNELRRRFQIVDDIPDAFIYFPSILGGLEMMNPFVSLLSMSSSCPNSPLALVEHAFDRDEEDYDFYQEAYATALENESDHGNASMAPLPVPRTTFPPPSYGPMHHGPLVGLAPRDIWQPENPATEPFFTLQEFTAFAEETSLSLLDAYTKLLESPMEEPAEPTDSVQNLFTALSSMTSEEENNTKGCGTQFSKLSTYWKWVVMLHHKEAKTMTGGLSLCGKENLPIGLLGVMKSERVRWWG